MSGMMSGAYGGTGGGGFGGGGSAAAAGAAGTGDLSGLIQAYVPQQADDSDSFTQLFFFPQTPDTNLPFSNINKWVLSITVSRRILLLYIFPASGGWYQNRCFDQSWSVGLEGECVFEGWCCCLLLQRSAVCSADAAAESWTHRTAEESDPQPNAQRWQRRAAMTLRNSKYTHCLMSVCWLGFICQVCSAENNNTYQITATWSLFKFEMMLKRKCVLV